MKIKNKPQQQTIRVCDTCKTAHVLPKPCMECGKDFCAGHGREFEGDLHLRGEHLGYWCNDCISELQLSWHGNPNALFNAFWLMDGLKREYSMLRGEMEGRAIVVKCMIERLCKKDE